MCIRDSLDPGESAGSVKSLLHFPLTFVVVFRTNENVSIRPLVLAQLSQCFSDFIVHRNVSRSAVLGLSRRDDVAKEIDLTTLHSQLFAKTHPCSECNYHGWPPVSYTHLRAHETPE